MVRTHLGFDNHAVLAKYQQENSPLISVFIRHGLGLVDWVVLAALFVGLNVFDSKGCAGCHGLGVGAGIMAFGLEPARFF
ncbi:hypothetical protein DSLASN_46760 [Desulfoluna limicola]|uniref:Uncharacterized protein n=1 Tax=Desulfoluna limicola TaxID=2810562 RepID=A0ABM7PND7_9BACT|nr:hypothetical protein [Desulfoluna limicola]BCS99044.1 hypothetical protein DSLASN_46760 [Desulfoluna limicola]